MEYTAFSIGCKARLALLTALGVTARFTARLGCMARQTLRGTSSLEKAFPRLSTQKVNAMDRPGPAVRTRTEHSDMGEHALAHAAISGPYNFASAVLRDDQDHCLGRQCLRRGSPPSAQVAPEGIRRVGARTDGKRAPEEIDAST